MLKPTTKEKNKYSQQLQIIIKKTSASIIGFFTIAIGLSSNNIIKEYVTYAPLFLIMTLLIDRGRSEYALRNGISKNETKAIFKIILTIISIITISCLAAQTIDTHKKVAFLFFILSIQAIGQAYTDITIKGSVKNHNNDVNILLHYQIFSASAILLGTLISLHFSEYATIGILAIGVAPLIWPAITNSVDNKTNTQNSACKNQKTIPNTSITDLIIKIFPLIIYATLIYFQQYIKDIEFTARAYLFTVGVANILTIKNHSENINKEHFITITLISIFTFYGLQALPQVLEITYRSDQLLDYLAMDLANPIMMIPTIILSIASTIIYSWNLKR